MFECFYDSKYTGIFLNLLLHMLVFKMCWSKERGLRITSITLKEN
jgi:hypothetical protein